MNSSIVIRSFKSDDIAVIVQLFKEAVATINIRHYSADQVAIWTAIDIDRWQTSLEKNITLVAEVDRIIVGFTDMTREGYLDRLYVHKDYQARFVTLRLFKAIEQAARDLGLKKITTDCSITAKTPAERMGFVVIKEQAVEKRGIMFINYHMEKNLE
jgi:putative acetyltransferase